MTVQKIMIWMLTLILLVTTVSALTEHIICESGQGQAFGRTGGSYYIMATNFTLNETGNVSVLTFYSRGKIGTPTDAEIQIRSDNAGEPDSTILGNGTTSYACSNCWVNVTIPATTLSADTPYWAVYTTIGRAAEVNGNVHKGGISGANCPNTYGKAEIEVAYNPGNWATDYSNGFALRVYYNATAPGPEPTTDVALTITDQWNGSNIQTFNVNISWSNGSTTEHTTSTGTVSLVNITAGNINVTYYNMTDYFNQTISDTLTANISNTVTTNTYQAVLCLNASAKVSEAYITPDNFTIGTNTSSSCFNITAGNHNVLAQLSGWYNQNQTVTVAALSNATQTVVNMSYANLTIYAIDGTTNESLSGYDLTFLSLNHSGWSGETASSVTNHSAHLINGTYNVTLVMPGYAVTGSQANVSLSGQANYTFTLYKSNSVSITIRDEITGLPIYDNVTVRFSSNTSTWENTTNTSTLFVHNITATNYSVLFYSSNYSTRTYVITVGPASTQFLTAYLISSTYSTILTIKDIDTGVILDGVTITMSKQINATWSTIESKLSDISGKAQFYYDPIAHYRFYLSNPEYEDYVFYLNPILFSTYDVFMAKTSVLNYSVDYDGISVIYSPEQFFNNQNATFNFLISSPAGLLTDYGIKLTYPGGSDIATGNNAIGEQLSADVNLSNATTFDYVVLEWNYTTSLSGTRTYVVNLPIISNHSAGTWLTNKDKTYGLGIFERILIATIIVIFVVGIATMVGMVIPGVALGLFMFGFLVFIGFIPIWAILPSMLVGIMFLIWKSGGY